ncbi:hypothetical protein [Kineosporia babensis]|uniref:Uncharacterized protein n=1 Tax=Kineosporia babensis TaxID=499548 RepID=A0A9X1NMQ2_9ACTN|nr:hypothetical protein [Kineosporia babensis]MCD5316576.1 hypothetical protein [Kineosporia babensis]
MNAQDGGGNQRPDLDLDQPDPGDAQVTALFRAGLRPGPGADLRAIERRARKKHRTSQALATGAVSAAAAIAAVTVVISPWSTGTGGEGVPAGPTPSVTQTPLDTSIPDVTKSSLLHTGDLSDENWSVVGVERLVAEGPPQDLSGEPWAGGVCVDETYGTAAPESAWERTWVSGEGNVPADYTVTERIAQWPGKPDQPAAVLDGLRADLPECTSGPGMEGLSVTTDRTDDAELVVPHLATTLEDGQNIPQAQAFVLWGDALISVRISVPASDGGPDVYVGNEDEAYTGAMQVLDSAIYRLKGRTPGDGSPSGLQSPVSEVDETDPSATDLPVPTGTDSRTGDGQ